MTRLLEIPDDSNNIESKLNYKLIRKGGQRNV